MLGARDKLLAVVSVGALIVLLFCVFGYILCKHYLWCQFKQHEEDRIRYSKQPVTIRCRSSIPEITYHKVQSDISAPVAAYQEFSTEFFLQQNNQEFGNQIKDTDQLKSYNGSYGTNVCLAEQELDAFKNSFETPKMLSSDISGYLERVASLRRMSSERTESDSFNTQTKHLKRYRSENFIITRAKSVDHVTSFPLPRGLSSENAMQPRMPLGGQLEFALFYNSLKKTLEITVGQLLNIHLDPHSFIGVLDTYQQSDKPSKSEKAYLLCDEYGELKLVNNEEVEYFIYITLLPRKAVRKYTKSILGNNTVTFNETMSITGYSLEYIRCMTLCFHALCKFGKEDKPNIIGEVKQPLTDISSSTILTFTPFLNRCEEALHLESSLTTSTDLGYLEIFMFYDAISQKLTVTIVTASGLPNYGFTGQSNISIKVGLYLYCNFIEKKKGKSVRYGKSEFNETFTFNIDREKQPYYDLVFEIRHHRPFYKKQIGYVTVGLSAGIEGKQHWTELLDFYWNTKRHKIMPFKPSDLL